ncbi:MAG: hypothetical protein IPK55_15060 [Streptococcus sp.]|nr:hypothetical protein [Streptococcus sp.]
MFVWGIVRTSSVKVNFARQFMNFISSSLVKSHNATVLVIDSLTNSKVESMLLRFSITSFEGFGVLGFWGFGAWGLLHEKDRCDQSHSLSEALKSLTIWLMLMSQLN